MDIIFDLDGTLVDSSLGVLDALQYSFKENGIETQIPLRSNIIGPPLKQMIINILGETISSNLLESIEGAFKNYYDSSGIFKTKPFDGVSIMLDLLAAQGHMLYIATNKRCKPTSSLMNHLSWNKYFCRVYSLDSINPEANDKADLISKIIEFHNLQKSNTIYVGDKKEDLDAANLCNVRFIGAKWGYSDDIEGCDGFDLKMPNEIFAKL
jgi:phosphoglycolate phosphatase